MKKIIILIACGVLTFGSFAQRMTISQYRLINYKILELMEAYDNSGTFSQRNHVELFSKLFVSDTDSIYNDCFPEYSQKNVTVNEYSKMFEKSIYKHYYTIYNISFDKLDSVSEEIYAVNMTFEKKINFISKKGNKRYPEIPLKLNATIQSNLKDSTVKFQTIRCTQPVDEQFGILSLQKMENKNWANLMTGTLSFDDDSVYLEENIKNFRSIQPTTPDVFISIDKDNEDSRYNYLHLKELKYSIGFNFMSALSFYQSTLTSTSRGSFSNFNSQSKGFEFGVDIMMKILNKSEARILFQTGLYGSLSELKLDGSYNERYNDIDPDGGTYSRLIDLTMHEDNSFLHAVIPVSFRYEYFINNEILIYGAAGIKNYICLKQNYIAFGKSFYRGYYPELYDVTIDQNGIYDFGQFDENLQNVKQNTKVYIADYLLSAGGSYIFDNVYAIDLGFIYQASFMNLNKPIQGYQMSKIFNGFNSMVSALDDFKRKAIGLELKLRYKF